MLRIFGDVSAGLPKEVAVKSMADIGKAWWFFLGGEDWEGRDMPRLFF